MSVDEAICLTLYAFAFDTDKTAQLTHLKQARRRYKKSINNMDEEISKQEAQKTYETHAVLKYGKKNQAA